MYAYTNSDAYLSRFTSGETSEKSGERPVLLARGAARHSELTKIQAQPGTNTDEEAIEAASKRSEKRLERRERDR